jgi:hypothetical protein
MPSSRTSGAAGCTCFRSGPVSVRAPRVRRGEDARHRLPRVLVELERLGAELRKRRGAELLHVDELLDLLRRAGQRFGQDLSDARSPVLVLRAGFLQDDDILEAIERNALPLADLDHQCRGLFDAGHLHLGEGLAPGLGITGEPEARDRAVHPGEPGILRVEELPALVRLGVRTEVPHMAAHILGEVVDRLLADLAAVDVLVESPARLGRR